MPSGVYVDVAIQSADDGPGALGSGDTGKALTWDNGTGRFVMATAGVTDHTLLSNLDYPAGHTGFAGTGVANTFARQQTIQASDQDCGTLAGEELSNGDFGAGLTIWTDDGTGWSVISGAAVHAPGVTGNLTQSIVTLGNAVYMIEVSVTGRTTGWIDIFDSENIDIYSETNGVFRAMDVVVGITDTIYIRVSSDFDGRLEYVSFQRVVNGFPSNVEFKNQSGAVVSEIRVFNGGIFYGLGAGKLNRNPNNIGIGDGTLNSIINESGNVSVGAFSGANARCNNGLFIGSNTGIGETTDSIMHIGNNGDLISGTMADGFAANQTLTIHAATVAIPDLPTSDTGAIWLDGGRLTIGTPTGVVDVPPSTTARASLRVRSGTAPTTPNAGDIWFDGTNLSFYDGVSTKSFVLA